MAQLNSSKHSAPANGAAKTKLLHSRDAQLRRADKLLKVKTRAAFIAALGLENVAGGIDLNGR